MSETNTNVTKQFLDKIGLNALWDKICSIFISKTDTEYQSDWNVTDTSLHSYIKNKPSLAPSNAQKNVQSDWNEADDSSDAFIKNKTHGESLIDVRTIGSYTHTNDITNIKYRGRPFELELGVKTQVNSGPPVWVTLTSSNTILIEASDSGWINSFPVTIIDIQKIDEKYLPDSVLNVNVNIPQSDWNESNPGSLSYIQGRTHWIEYSSDEISSPGQYNLDNYGATYPVIINFYNNVYEVHEGENRLSWGPPLLVNLSGNILTVDESSYVNENYAIKVGTSVQKLNQNIFLNTITLDMLDEVWEDVIGHDDAVLDEGTLNTRKLG
jgi:hypothetical protein